MVQTNNWLLKTWALAASTVGFSSHLRLIGVSFIKE